MTPTTITPQYIFNIFEEIAGCDIDWSAAPSNLAAYMVGEFLNVPVAYDYSPITEDGAVAIRFWAAYDAAYRVVLSMTNTGEWDNVCAALAIGDFYDVRNTIAGYALEVAEEIAWEAAEVALGKTF